MSNAKLLFDQYKNRNKNAKYWKGKKVERFDPRRNGGKVFNKNTIKWFQGNNSRNNNPYNPSENKKTKPTTFYMKKTSQKSEQNVGSVVNHIISRIVLTRRKIKTLYI